MKQKIIIQIISALFILLFVYAAVSKLLDFQTFVAQIGQSPMLTDIAVLIASFIPLVELLVSVLLIGERTQLVGLYASFSLMTMFTVYIILASHFSDYIPCSCGGVIQNLSWTEHLVFNMLFMAGGLWAVLFHGVPKEANHSTEVS